MSNASEELQERTRNNPRLSDPRSTEELLRIALTEEDEDRYWDAVWTLQWRPTVEVFETARRLTGSADAHERVVGADILAQLGASERMRPDEVAAILARLLETDQDLDVLYSAAVALGHNPDPRAVPALIRHKNHPDEDVRYGVVFGLLTREDQEAISALIELSEDADDDVRDWATFGLGSQIDTDTPEIRDALWRRVDDPVPNVRGEALRGLAGRHDPGVWEPLLRDLWAVHADGSGAGLLLTEAAEELADPRLCPALLVLQELERRVEGEPDRALADAIAACCGDTSEADDT